MWFVLALVSSSDQMPLAMCVKSLLPPLAVKVNVLAVVALINLAVMSPGVNDVTGSPLVGSSNGPIATTVASACSISPRFWLMTLPPALVRACTENVPMTALTDCESTVPATTTENVEPTE
mgnify:CR=1 FL=1